MRSPLLVALAAAAGALALGHFTVLQSADAAYGDLLTAHFATPQPQHDRVVLVTLGEESVGAMACRSPLDRRVLADLVDMLARVGVAAIGLDVLFDQPTVPELDEMLRRRIQNAGVPVVAVSALAGTALNDRQRAFLERFLDGIPHGHANLAKDGTDGTVRWHLPHAPDGAPSFPARLAEVAGAAVPDAPFRIAWWAGPDVDTPPFAAYPAEMVGMVPPAWLAGRVVLVGTVLAGTDRHRTPVSPVGGNTAGVEVQAHVLAQILDGRSNPVLSFRGQVAVTLLLAGLGVALALRRWPVVWLAAAGLLLALLVWVGGAALFAAGGPLLLPMAPTLALTGGIALMAAHLSKNDRTERRVLMELFARHVSQPVAEVVWKNRAAFLSGGRPKPQQLTASVLFCDVEGFTAICEELEPEPLIRWLEDYLDAMVRIVVAHEGIVLRVVGDGVLAVFGAPVARTSQAEIDADAVHAVHCALAMGQALEDLNARWWAEGLPMAGIRIGIHTGPVVAGSLGGLRHLEYSLLGDTANTAARLEEHAKMVGARSTTYARVVIGDTTACAVDGIVPLLSVGEVALRGKRHAVGVWLVRHPTQIAGDGFTTITTTGEAL
ncbi:MAG TPA: adenylate/guanylate cyclase domain-containing protein [Azospirillum sp.]|nr:adenylate/guanylate cyclase domain-containing protein [Azospirillum sp.]